MATEPSRKRLPNRNPAPRRRNTGGWGSNWSFIEKYRRYFRARKVKKVNMWRGCSLWNGKENTAALFFSCSDPFATHRTSCQSSGNFRSGPEAIKSVRVGSGLLTKFPEAAVTLLTGGGGATNHTPGLGTTLPDWLLW